MKLGWRKDESGQSMVEFALMFVPLVFLMAGIFDLARAIYIYDALAEAARAGARYAIVRGENATTADRVGPCAAAGDCDCNTTSTTYNLDKVRAAVLTRTIVMDASTLVLRCEWPDSNSNARGRRVAVTVRFPFVPILADFIGVGSGASITMQSSTAMVIEY